MCECMIESCLVILKGQLLEYVVDETRQNVLVSRDRRVMSNAGKGTASKLWRSAP